MRGTHLRCGSGCWPRADRYGITPYGTETMHVLRAEKGYPIIGQDTDGTVTPHDLGMAWAVSKKKPDFIGKRSFSRAENQNPLRKQLVGLLPVDRVTRLPEGSQIVEFCTDDALPPPPVPMLGSRHLELSQRRARPHLRAGAGQGGSVPHRRDPACARRRDAGRRSRSPARCWSTRKERAAMADTLERTSPLQPWAEQFARLPDAVDDRRGTVHHDGRTARRPIRARCGRPRRVCSVSSCRPRQSTYAKSGDTR